MPNIRLPAIVEGVYLWQQNDPPDSKAAETFQKVVENFHGQGKRVRLARPPEDVKDANDLVRPAAGGQGRGKGSDDGAIPNPFRAACSRRRPRRGPGMSWVPSSQRRTVRGSTCPARRDGSLMRGGASGSDKRGGHVGSGEAQRAPGPPSIRLGSWSKAFPFRSCGEDPPAASPIRRGRSRRNVEVINHAVRVVPIVGIVDGGQAALEGAETLSKAGRRRRTAASLRAGCRGATPGSRGCRPTCFPAMP